MRAGRTAIRPVQRFDTTGFASGLAALVPGTDEPRLEPRPTGRGQALMVDFAVEAGREALVHAGLVGGPRLGLVLGTNVEDRPDGYHVLVERIGDRLGVGGPRVVTSIACASSASALAFGASLVERG